MAAPQKVQDLQSLPHILVVDDDDRIRSLVSKYLNENGFLSFTAANAAEAKDIMQIGLFDALVVDVMMPGQNGRDFIKDLRAKKDDVPVILLTAMGEVEDRLGGLSSGADDYLTKPFDPRELVMRLQAILRRRPQKETLRKFQIGRWRFDPSVPEITDGDEVIRLTDVDMNLLNALTRQLGAVLSREELAAICGVDAGERTIDVQVTRLRKKIEDDSKNPRYLQTIRGKGYLLRAEEVLE